MRNGTMKESKCADSLWRQAPDIKRTLTAGGQRVTGGASLLSPMRPKCALAWLRHQLVVLSLESGARARSGVQPIPAYVTRSDGRLLVK
jgi:hypothetical protein